MVLTVKQLPGLLFLSGSLLCLQSVALPQQIDTKTNACAPRYHVVIAGAQTDRKAPLLKESMFSESANQIIFTPICLARKEGRWEHAEVKDQVQLTIAIPTMAGREAVSTHIATRRENCQEFRFHYPASADHLRIVDVIIGPVIEKPMSKGSWTCKNGKPETVNFEYGTELTGEDIARLSGFDSIAQIYMGFAGVNSEYVTIEGDLLGLGRLNNLEVVHLNKDGIVDDDLKFIASLPKIRELEFNASNGEDGCTERCADHLSWAKTLRELRIYNGPFTDNFIDKITRAMPNLEELMLGSPELTDESLRFIAERCKKLKSLSIESDHFTAEGLKHLDKLPNLKNRRVRAPALRKQRHDLEGSPQRR